MDFKVAQNFSSVARQEYAMGRWDTADKSWKHGYSNGLTPLTAAPTLELTANKELTYDLNMS